VDHGVESNMINAFLYSNNVKEKYRSIRRTIVNKRAIRVGIASQRGNRGKVVAIERITEGENKNIAFETCPALRPWIMQIDGKWESWRAHCPSQVECARLYWGWWSGAEWRGGDEIFARRAKSEAVEVARTRIKKAQKTAARMHGAERKRGGGLEWPGRSAGSISEGVCGERERERERERGRERRKIGVVEVPNRRTGGGPEGNGAIYAA
jgi:hypothetical protein